MEDMEKRVRAIEERNKKVEQDKAWEISFMRKCLLVLFTYVAIGAYLQVIAVVRPWLSAIVPALAFSISTLTMPYCKTLWLKGHKNTGETKNLHS